MSLTFALLLIFAYLLGSIPFGLIWGRTFADLDVREHGSGNIGATNVNRVLGRKLGAATLLSDMLKAIVAVLLARFFLEEAIAPVIVGFAAVLGHCYPIFLKFKGGKGVATAFGMLVVAAPLTGVVALGSWLLSYRISKISSLSALIAGGLVPIVAYFEKGIAIACILILLVALIIFRHKENIERLRQGSELKP